MFNREVAIKLPESLAWGTASWESQSASQVGLPFLDTYRTLCAVPGAELMRALQDVRNLSIAA